MDNQQFKIVSDLIVKYMMNTISDVETETLEAWISERDENRELFNNIVSSENLYSKIDSYSDEKYLDAYQKFIAKKNISVPKKTFSFVRIIKYAAVIAIIATSLSVVYYYQNIENKPFEQVILSQSYDVPILKLSNGQIIKFDSENSDIDKIADKSGIINLKDGEIEYPDNVANEAELSYNELIVPDKCRQKIVLSDKSVVWVNSNSSIRYPQSFGSNERRVYITGEALFEVAKDTLRPFIVETTSLSVNVTGTLFNVNAYAEQSNTTVTLINGSVTSNVKDQVRRLVPNQQLIFNKENDSTEIREVIAGDYALWVNGLYVFNKVKLKDISGLIERCYGIACHFKNEEYKEMEITGELDVNKGVMSFIDMLSKCSDFKFSLSEDSITIQ